MAEEQDKQEDQMSQDERVGFHKGSINTLVAERQELLKIVQVTEQLIGVHIQELEKLGVKIVQGSEKPGA